MDPRDVALNLTPQRIVSRIRILAPWIGQIVPLRPVGTERHSFAYEGRHLDD
jgi:hypothetical protein